MEVTDRSFNLSQTTNYTLSIRFIPDGFCFIVFNRHNKKILHFAEITNKNKEPQSLFRENAANNPILQHPFEEILCVWDTPLYTLLPNSVFSEENTALFWKLNFGADNAQKLTFFSDKLKLPEIVNIYAVPTAYVAFLRELFPPVQFINQQSAQIISSLLENRKENNSQVYIRIHRDFFDALVLQKGKIVLANSYRFQTKDEFLYFSINIFEQLQLDTGSTEIILSGETSEKDEKIAALRKYIRTISFKKITTDVSGLNLKKIPNLEQYINLFNLPLCVS
ncbi:MAG: DUF3822 family protein [Prevotellaceae bacterium]|jgi:hypothetical protein|nr:DUF3822 family protein [Prevotellaceae bacterium]